MDNRELAITLARMENEQSVKDLLISLGYWDDLTMWHPLGDNENNQSIIGNQQSNPDAAFVEKMVNSIDACLNKECLKRGIDPSGPDAPQTMNEALKQFYDIPEGGLAMIGSSRRAELAQNIIVAASGQQRGEMNLCIADRGEGQTPNRMPETILSLSKSNKLRIPFVQGKFNMGGTGALPFCGENHLQLIISKRCPDIPNTAKDDSYDKWSVTIVRKERTRDGRRSSMYTYLTDSAGNVLSFDADKLPIIPQAYVEGQRETAYECMEYGTFIKLFNYQLTGYKTSIVLDFYNRVSLLIPNLALPVRFRECRKYNAHTNESTLAGLVTRLEDDRSSNIEEGFPSSGSFVIDGQEVKCLVYLFKKDQQKKFRRKDGILFIVNGQTQGIIGDSFFTRVNLSYIKDSILVLADCTGIDVDHQEQLFMTSRDRLRTGEFSKELTSCIEQELKEHPGLKKAEHDRRSAALQDKLSNNKPLKDVLQSILKKSSVLSRIFISGMEIASPYNSTAAVGVQDTFVGKKHPTFFALKGKLKDGHLTKVVPANSSFRIQFSTDVENDYFYRPIEAGALILRMDGYDRQDLLQHLSLFNGVATLTIALPDGAAEGDSHVYSTAIVDDCIVNDFAVDFDVKVSKIDESQSGGSGKPHKPIDPNKKGKEQNPNGFAMPEIIEVNKDEWEMHDMTDFSALIYRPTDAGGDYYVNVDNKYLLTELKGMRDKNLIDLTRARYTYSMALIGMSIINYYRDEHSEDEEPDVSKEVSRITSMVAPILIPMLDSMANLSSDDIITEQ